MQTPTQCANLPKPIKAWINKFPSKEQIGRAYSPTFWSYTLEHIKEAYMADCPTLMQLAQSHGDMIPQWWIHLQVMALYGSSSSSDKGIVDGIPIFAASFAREVSTFKLSELMIFFARYKAGKYDNSYHTFDTRRIGNAFFKEFLPQRQIELDRIIKEEEQAKIEARRFVPPQGYTSLSWFQHLKERAAQGDEEAMTLLQKK